MSKLFQKVLDGRRSVRSYKEEKIFIRDLKKIVKDATKAPSSRNSQPWYFYISNKPKQLNSIKKIIRETRNIDDQNNYNYELGKAQAIIFIAMDKKKLKDRKNRNNYLLSVGAAIENLLLSAENLGISCCWFGRFEDYRKKLNKEINFKKAHTIVAGITLGYSAEKKKQKSSRKPMSEVMEVL